MNRMIYTDANFKKNFISCNTCKEELLNNSDELILNFYSMKHAWDNGWRRVSDIRYCPPDKEYAWICPDCCKKFNIK